MRLRLNQDLQVLNKVPVFIAKTYTMVSNQENSHVIMWNKSGDGFVVKDEQILAEEIFPKYFKHRNYCSFVRQLNMYGFKKLPSTQNQHHFYHQFFQKKSIKLLTNIQRKDGKPQKQTFKSLMQEEQVKEMGLMKMNELIPLNSKRKRQNELADIQNKQEHLEKMIQFLSEQNRKILEQNRQLLEIMSEKKHLQQQYLNNLFILGKRVLQIKEPEYEAKKGREKRKQKVDRIYSIQDFKDIQNQQNQLFDEESQQNSIGNMIDIMNPYRRM